MQVLTTPGILATSDIKKDSKLIYIHTPIQTSLYILLCGNETNTNHRATQRSDNAINLMDMKSNGLHQSRI